MTTFVDACRRVRLWERDAIGGVSVVLGLDWLLEGQSNFVAEVYEGPRSLVSGLPWLQGMQWWGVSFIVGGLAIVVGRHWLLSLFALSGGFGSWLCIAYVAALSGFGSNAISLVLSILSLYFALRLLLLISEVVVREQGEEPPVTPDEVGRVHVACPWADCPVVLPIPVLLRLTSPDDKQSVITEPDLSEVWSHAWTHEAQS